MNPVPCNFSFLPKKRIFCKKQLKKVNEISSVKKKECVKLQILIVFRATKVKLLNFNNVQEFEIKYVTAIIPFTFLLIIYIQKNLH